MSEFSSRDGTSFDTYSDINLRFSYAKNSILMPAAENLDRLTSQQRILWGIFYPPGAEIKPILKSDIIPSKMPALLPDIWMFDLISDDHGKLLEVNSRLQGSRIDAIYGRGTDDQYIVADYADRLSMIREDEDVRTINLALMMCDLQVPVIGHVKQLSDGLSHLSEHNLVIPVCHDSDQVNMMLGLTEVLPVSL